MKLLQKTIRNYFIYSVVVLLIAVPVFSLVIQRIVREEADEQLLTTKELLKPTILSALFNNTTDQLKFIDPNITIRVSPVRGTLSSPLSGSPAAFQESHSFHTRNDYDSVSHETVPTRVLDVIFEASGKRVLLQIKDSLVDNEDLISIIVKVQIFMLLLLLSGLFLINRNLSKRIWQPFYNTLEKLSNYKVERHQSLGLVKSSIKEFDDLNGSLEALTERVNRTYLNQKEFTENASHEMQTPLAIFQSKLELLMQTSAVDEEQAELIGELADASRRMSMLNKSLILLTRIENQQFTDTESVAIIPVIERFLTEFHPQSEEKQISMDADLQQEILLTANRPLVEILIGNLLSNAIRHNYNNGLILIACKGRTLIIQNTGKTLPLDEQLIFSRFHKESTDANSIGLGLQIARQICYLYGWTIGYEYKSRLHQFTVSF